MTTKIMLPNSIPKSQRVDWSMSDPGREWLYLYCASCGKDGGRVLRTDVPNLEEFAFNLCDPCAEKYGAIDGAYFVPDEVFFAKVEEATIERLGREFTLPELLKELEDSSSFLFQIAKDRNIFLASE